MNETKVAELSQAEAIRRLTRWVGRGIVDNAYAQCAAPQQAEHDLDYAEAALKQAPDVLAQRDALAEALGSVAAECWRLYHAHEEQEIPTADDERIEELLATAAAALEAVRRA